MTPFLALCLAFSLMALSSEDPTKKTNVSAVSSKNDSITSWIHASKNTSFSLEQRKRFLLKAYYYVKSSQADSLQARTLNKLRIEILNWAIQLCLKNKPTKACP
jgi:hypothetical protein